MYIGCSWVDRWERKTGNRPKGFKSFKSMTYAQDNGHTIRVDAETPASKEFRNKQKDVT